MNLEMELIRLMSDEIMLLRKALGQLTKEDQKLMLEKANEVRDERARLLMYKQGTEK